MKKLFNVMMLATTAALTLVSCAKVMETPNDENPSGGIPVVLNASSEDTKTEFDGLKPFWSVGDKVIVVSSTAAGGYNTFNTSIADRAEKASFNGTVPTTGKYYAVYCMGFGGNYITPGSFRFDLPYNQRPEGASTFDKKADILVSEALDITGTSDPIDARFTRMGAFLKVMPKSTLGYKVERVTVTSSDHVLAASIDIDLANYTLGEPDAKESKSVIAEYTEETKYALTADGSNFTYLGVLPVTLKKGEDITIEIIADGKVWRNTKTLESDLEIKAGHIIPIPVTLTNDNRVKELTVERVWGYYPNSGWPTSFVPANADRGVATDGENVYVTNTTDGTVVGIKITDQSKVTVNMTGVDGGFFKTCSAKTIYNPSTGKYILLVGSLANESDCNFNVYAWKDGIDQAPTKIISWNTNNGSPRRIGDFFTVSGDWSNGEIWARINQADPAAATTFVWKITDGVAGGVLGGGIGYAGSAGMGSVYKYSLDAPQVMVVTPNIAKFYTCKVESTWINANSDGIEWTDGSDVSAYAKRFGYTPFEFNGKKYIAYLHMYNAARGWLTVLNDTQGTAEGFMKTIIDNDIFFQGAVQINKDEASTDVVAGATYSGNTMANCSVAVLKDEVIIVGHQQNTGLAVFKMYMK